MRNIRGFTLIEIAVSLILLGIIATVSGMAIVTGTKGYVSTRENVAISQKAQLAAGRINRELMELSVIDSTSEESCIRYKVEAVSQNFRKIRLNKASLELNISSTRDCDCLSSQDTGDLLADQVGIFELHYEDQTGGVSSSPPSSLLNLRAIHIEFRLDRDDGNPGNTFETTICPRNNGNLNGPGSIS
ncbi:MAG: prepilin-type N-terminal cleavage/methylation domain-containing protein [Thermodesulfobacteriota bacterium]|nr:prepilin-type N-terminal cleavage/methylation domain-containing protein [Thermodesulfobacteriota bacterium]